MQNVVRLVAVFGLDRQHLTPIYLLLALVDFVVEHPDDLGLLLVVEGVQVYLALAETGLATGGLLVGVTEVEVILHAVHEVALSECPLLQECFGQTLGLAVLEVLLVELLGEY